MIQKIPLLSQSILISLLLALILSPVLESRIPAEVLVPCITLVGTILSVSRFGIIFRFLSWSIATILSTVILTPLVPFTAHYFVAEDPLPEKVDAIVVLSAEAPLADRLKSQGLERLLHGKSLFEQGKSQTLVLTDQLPYKGDPSKDRMRLLGTIGIHTVTVGPVQNTFDEATAVNQLALANNWKSIILVTSPFHSKRAKAIFQMQLTNTKVHSSPAEAREFDIELMVPCYERLKAARLMIYEIGGWAKNAILGRL